MWPDDILSPQAEDALASIALRDGLDLGLLCTTMLAGGSAAADKRTRFVPYQAGTWTVPPILWVVPVGDSGFRKTALDEHGFSAIREVQQENWRVYQGAHQFWLAGGKQGPEPKLPSELFISDYTPEGLQDALYASGRGNALVTDELVTLIDFGRYTGNKSANAGRGFILGCYEDHDYPVRRADKKRTFYIQHTGCAMFGGIQRRRIAALKDDLETDGFLQRCAVIIVPPPIGSVPGTTIVAGMDALHDAIKALCTLAPRTYTTTPDGSDCIHETEIAGKGYASITDYGEGWPGFAYKLHGLHARFALVLHLLEDPNTNVIPTERVRRAHRLVHAYLLQHAADFHGRLLGNVHDMQRDIAGWLLTRRNPPKPINGKEMVLAYNITNNIKSCRALTTKGIGEVLDRFVTGGWLTPEEFYPNNREWWFDPTIRGHFAQRAQAEQKRRAAIRDQIGKISAGRSGSSS
jgi:hypothetical protein